MFAERVKLVAGLIFNNLSLIEPFLNDLISLFGSIDLFSEIIPFSFTKYYEKEMGSNLKRLFFSFRELVLERELPEIKKITINLENKYRDRISKGRQINCDPGILTHARVVLASTKNYAHRIAIDDKIFAELTYTILEDKWTLLPWTYPDYRQKKVMVFFERVRGIYLKQRKKIIEEKTAHKSDFFDPFL